MSAKGSRSTVLGLVTVVVLVGLLAFLLGRGIGLERAAPPIEELTIERIELPDGGRILVHVVNGGQDPVTIQTRIGAWNAPAASPASSSASSRVSIARNTSRPTVRARRKSIPRRPRARRKGYVASPRATGRTPT